MRVTVEVDFENNAQEWWDALRAHPDGARIEAEIDAGSLDARDLAICEALPGWRDGPTYARTALIVKD